MTYPINVLKFLGGVFFMTLLSFSLKSHLSSGDTPPGELIHWSHLRSSLVYGRLSQGTLPTVQKVYDKDGFYVLDLDKWSLVVCVGVSHCKVFYDRQGRFS